mmetsp:Transcript_5681/g.20648  ORF Transcript_5681/g.20648 Transcript_5681/m.20648 type:complete len:231 (-) Transcript_5681:891-1583(-)
MTPSKRIVPHFPKPRRIARGSRRKGTAARHARMAECRDARRCRSRGNINRRETTFFSSTAPRRASHRVTPRDGADRRGDARGGDRHRGSERQALHPRARVRHGAREPAIRPPPRGERHPGRPRVRRVSRLPLVLDATGVREVRAVPARAVFFGAARGSRVSSGHAQPARVRARVRGAVLSLAERADGSREREDRGGGGGGGGRRRRRRRRRTGSRRRVIGGSAASSAVGS